MSFFFIRLIMKSNFSMMSFFPVFFTISIFSTFINLANTMETTPDQPITTQPISDTSRDTDVISRQPTIAHDNDGGNCARLCNKKTCAFTVASLATGAAVEMITFLAPNFLTTPLLQIAASLGCGIFVSTGTTALLSACGNYRNNPYPTMLLCKTCASGLPGTLTAAITIPFFTSSAITLTGSAFASATSTVVITNLYNFCKNPFTRSHSCCKPGQVVDDEIPMIPMSEDAQEQPTTDS